MAALSSCSSVALLTTTLKPSLPNSSSHNNSSSSFNFPSNSKSNNNHHLSSPSPSLFTQLSSTSTSTSERWRTRVSFFPSFLKKGKDIKTLKEELFQTITPLDRGADATPDDQERVDQIARELEALNPVKEPLKSDLLNGKWELIYTTSRSILQTQFVTEAQILKIKSKLPGYQCGYVKGPKYGIFAILQSGMLSVDDWIILYVGKKMNLGRVTADLMPLNSRKVAVKFDYFKILGLIPIKAPEKARGELEITYLDKELRVSRGDKGNLFILKMIDPSYRVPVPSV